MSEPEKCACGRPLHYTDPELQKLIMHFVKQLGPNVTIMVPGFHRGWKVPRHFIALHGLRVADLPALAKEFGFEEVKE